METNTNEFDLLKDRNKNFEAENIDLKCKLDNLYAQNNVIILQNSALTQQIATLNKRLEEFLENSKSKRNNKKTTTTSTTAKRTRVHTLSETSDEDSNNITDNVTTTPTASTSATNNKTQEDNDNDNTNELNLWQSLLTKQQYRINKKSNEKNASQIATTPIQLNKMNQDSCSTLSTENLKVKNTFFNKLKTVIIHAYSPTTKT